MVGIRATGTYNPIYRLERKEIARAMGTYSMGGVKAVSNYDEDSVTMAVEAVRSAVDGINPSEIEALLFASITSPYKDKQSASTVALGVDLKEGVFTSDLSNSIRSGAAALTLAMDRVKSGSSKNVVITASDCRIGIGGSEFEQFYGDGAAALVISNEDLVATIEGSYEINDTILDVWQTSLESFPTSWEDRFIKTKGYQKTTIAVIRGLMEKYQLTVDDFQKVVIAVPDYKIQIGICKSFGFDIKTKLQESFFSSIGFTGSAHPLLMLAAAIAEAEPNDKILFVAYGDGAQAFVLSVTGLIKDRDVGHPPDSIESVITLENYEQYLKIKGLIATEAARRPLLPSSASYMWRERNYYTRFHGCKCLNCGTEQYPRQRVCYECKAKDNFEEIKLASRKGKIITYTKDYLFPCPIPPHIQTVVELEGGCRVYMMMTDVKPDEVKSHMPVKMTFRMLHDRSNFYHYSWKCSPIY